MIQITFPDGKVREYEKGTSALEIAKSISEGLARNVLAAKVNGEVWDATRPIQDDATLNLLTWDDPCLPISVTKPNMTQSPVRETKAITSPSEDRDLQRQWSERQA